MDAIEQVMHDFPFIKAGINHINSNILYEQSRDETSYSAWMSDILYAATKVEKYSSKDKDLFEQTLIKYYKSAGYSVDVTFTYVMIGWSRSLWDVVTRSKRDLKPLIKHD